MLSFMEWWRFYDSCLLRSRGFEKDPRKTKFELHVHVPLDTIVGTYDLTGRALLIQVQSSGAINLTFGS